MVDYSKKSDPDLLNLVKIGNKSAYSEIYSRYQELLFRHAFRMLQDRAEAEDVVQEVFIMLWEKKDTASFHTSLPAYLYNCVRNRIFNHLNHQKVIGRYLDSIRDFLEKGRFTTDELLREKELAAIIEAEIAAMPPKMREIFLLSRDEELSHKAIGQQLRISDKTVKQQIYKAVKKLKVKLSTFLTVFPFL